MDTRVSGAHQKGQQDRLSVEIEASFQCSFRLVRSVWAVPASPLCCLSLSVTRRVLVKKFAVGSPGLTKVQRKTRRWGVLPATLPTSSTQKRTSNINSPDAGSLQGLGSCAAEVLLQPFEGLRELSAKGLKHQRVRKWQELLDLVVVLHICPP